jgi:AcrR family transcriptional regulator
MNELDPKKRLRAPQDRARNTRRRLIKAAVGAFSAIGFHAATVADLEKDAKVQRGLLLYHFGSKEGLWRAVVGELGEKLLETLRQGFHAELASGDPLKAAVAAAIRASVEVPEFARILGHGLNPDPGFTSHILNDHIRRLLVAMEPIAGRPLTVHDYSIISGLTIYPIVWGGEARHVFGVEPRSEEFVREYIEIVTALLRKHWGGG